MIDDTSLRGVNIVEKERIALSTIGDEIRAKASLMLSRSLETSNTADASTALLVFHNLGELPQRVVTTIDGLRARVDAAANAIGSRAIGSSVATSTAGVGGGGESAFRTALWAQIDAWTEEAFVAVTRCDHLQRALSKQRDPTTRRTLLSELLHIVKSSTTASSSNNNNNTTTAAAAADVNSSVIVVVASSSATTTATQQQQQNGSGALASVLGDATVSLTQSLWRSVVHTLEARISRVAGETGIPSKIYVFSLF